MKYRQGFSCEGDVYESEWNGTPEKNMTLVTYDASTGYCVQLELGAKDIARLRRCIDGIDKKAEKIRAKKKRK